MSTRKGIDVIWALDAVIYALLFIYALVWKKKSFIKIPALIFYLKLQTSTYGRFGIFGWGAGESGT